MSGYPLFGEDSFEDAFEKANSFCFELEKSRDEFISKILYLCTIKCGSSEIVRRMRKIVADYHEARDRLCNNSGGRNGAARLAPGIE